MCFAGDVWHLLAWQSKNPHAPVTVAAAPAYWAQLDVVATVRNLLADCPRFWASQELHNSLQDGQLVRQDSAFFAQQLLAILNRSKADSQQQRGCATRGGSSSRDGNRDRHAADRVLVDVGDWVSGMQLAPLCRRLMHLLPETALLSAFARAAAALAGSGSGERAAAASPAEAETAARQLVFGTRWHSLQELLLANAISFKAIELWCWMHEDDSCLQVCTTNTVMLLSLPEMQLQKCLIFTAGRPQCSLVHALQAAQTSLAALQRLDSLPVLWGVLRHAACQSSSTASARLLAEKLSAHLYLHEHVGGDVDQLEHLLQLCSIPFRRLPGPSQHQLLAEPPKRKHKKHKHSHKKSSKKRKRSASPEVSAPVAVNGHTDVTWQVGLQGEVDQAEQCSAQQLHAVTALHALAGWLTKCE